MLFVDLRYLETDVSVYMHLHGDYSCNLIDVTGSYGV